MIFPNLFETKPDLVKKIRHNTVGICTICRGEMHIMGTTSIKWCSCREKLLQQYKYAEAGIYERYWDWTLNHLDDIFKQNNPDAFVEFKKNYADIESFVNSGKCMFLFGSHGTGKTGSALELLKKAVTLREEFVTSLNYKFRGGVFTLSEISNLIVDAALFPEQNQLLKSVYELDIIVIDEFDKETRVGSKDKYTGVEFGSFFNHFYNKKASIILISNYSVEELRGNIHTDDVIDRIETFDYHIKLVGASYRKRQKKTKVI